MSTLFVVYRAKSKAWYTHRFPSIIGAWPLDLILSPLRKRMTTTAMDRIPYEVWEEILRYLPSNKTLAPAMGLNRTTYNIVLDKLYRAIHWRCLDEEMIKSLICLRDPTIAARVRSLALETENILVERKRQPWLRAKATRVLQLSRKSIRRRRSVSIRSDVRAFKATLRETKDVLKAMRQAFDKMTRLECCIIDAGNQLHPNSMEPPARPLLVTMSLVVGRNLRYLVLQGTVHHLSAWVTSAHMERLEELMMTVLAYPAHFGSSSEHSEDMKFIVSRLAPFINSISLDSSERSLTSRICATSFSKPPYIQPFNRTPTFYASSWPRRFHQAAGFILLASFNLTIRGVNSLYRSQEADIDIVTTLAERLGHRLDNIHLYQYSLSIPQFEVMATMKTNITLLHHIQGQTLAAAFFDFLSLHVAHFVALGIVYEEIYGNRDAPYNYSDVSTFLVRAPIQGAGHDLGGWPLRNIRICDHRPQAEFIIHATDMSIVSMTREAAPRATIILPGCNLSTVLSRVRLGFE
ncbi:hypothetical protein AB1N83_005009 [Pleurotus pulmonarius]